MNAHESYVRELNRGNVCVVARKRKSWAWFNFNVHARPSIHCLYLFTHVKSTRQWKSAALYVACVAGVRKGRGNELGHSTTRREERRVPFLSPSRAPHALGRPNSPFPFQRLPRRLHCTRHRVSSCCSRATSHAISPNGDLALRLAKE